MMQPNLYLVQKLQNAMQLHQKGKFEDAKKEYLSILKIQPKNAEVLHGLGLIAYQESKHQDALKYLNQAIKIDADPSFYNNRGTVYFSIKKFTEAEIDYKKVLKLEPSFEDAQFNLANLYSDINRTQDAIEIFNKLLESNPQNVEVLFNRGNAFKREKNLEEAIKSYDRVIEIQPFHFNAMLNRGNAYLGLENIDEAISSFSKALEFNPNLLEALVSRASAYYVNKSYDLAIKDHQNVLELKQDHKESYFGIANALKDKLFLKEAVNYYQKAIEIDPNYYDALTNLANTLRRLKAFDEAAVYYSKAVQIRPNSPEPYSNLGNILHDLKRTDLAIDAYAKALEINPKDVRAIYNLGNIFKELNQLDDALRKFEHVLEIEPNSIETKFAKGMILLTQGKYKEGFQLYEYRWQRDSLIKKLRKYPQPLWTGKENLNGKTLLIYIEQGLGDTIQFSRFIPQIAVMGANIIFEVQKPLISLMNQIQGVTSVIPYESEYENFDYFCPLLSIPAALGIEVEDLPLSKGYIKANTDYLDKWQKILGEKTKPRVGLVCSGNQMHENDQNRSILLFNIIPFLPKEIEYITLQKEMRDVDRQLIEKYPLFKSFGDQLESFEDTAALCELMDVVISVDTSVAHLSGALAKKTYLLLPYCPDWRWMLNRTDSPWYDSMQIYRQEFANNWQSTFQKLSDDLKMNLLN